MVWHFIQEHPTKVTIMVAFNGRLVLDQLKSKKSIDPFTAHADLCHICKNIQLQMSCTIKLVHVKGHQDKGYPTVLLREAWLNIEADLMAKSCIDNGTPKHPNLLPFEPWQLLINNKKATKQHYWVIQLAMNSPAAQQYWRGKTLGHIPAHGDGCTGNGESTYWEHTGQELMGDKTHHSSFCAWQEYGTERKEISSSMPPMSSQNGG